MWLFAAAWWWMFIDDLRKARTQKKEERQIKAGKSADGRVLQDVGYVNNCRCMHVMVVFVTLYTYQRFILCHGRMFIFLLEISIDIKQLNKTAKFPVIWKGGSECSQGQV